MAPNPAPKTHAFKRYIQGHICAVLLCQGAEANVARILPFSKDFAPFLLNFTFFLLDLNDLEMMARTSPPTNTNRSQIRRLCDIFI